MVGLGNIDDVYKHYLVVIEENQQLKELIKECKHIIEWYKADYKGADVLNEDVITKIDNAMRGRKQ